jgi:hypothetical protein
VSSPRLLSATRSTPLSSTQPLAGEPVSATGRAGCGAGPAPSAATDPRLCGAALKAVTAVASCVTSAPVAVAINAFSSAATSA